MRDKSGNFYSMGRNRGRNGNRSGQGVGGMVEFDGHCIVGSFFCEILTKRPSSKGFYQFRDGGVIYIWKES